MKIYFAPMEGVVDYSMRKLMRKVGGVDISVTEFVRVTDHTLPRKVFIRYCPELLNDNERSSTRIQLLGNDPHLLASNAKKAASLGAPGIDLNFGCPAKTVNRHRGGACLLDDTSLIHDIVAHVRDAVPVDTPVSAKIRLGYNDRDSYLANAEAIEKAGANELVVHARSKADGYKPPAYWSYIGRIRQHLSIPVVANGEIWSVEDFEQCRLESQCEDFMLGRGLLANPGLAKTLQRYTQSSHHSGTTTSPSPNNDVMTWADICEYLLAFFIETSQMYPKKYTGNRAKQWLFYMKRNFPEAARLFETIKSSRDFDSILSAIKTSQYATPETT